MTQWMSRPNAKALVRAADDSDPYGINTSIRSLVTATAIMRSMGASEEQISDVTRAVMRDIGHKPWCATQGHVCNCAGSENGNE